MQSDPLRADRRTTNLVVVLDCGDRLKGSRCSAGRAISKIRWLSNFAASVARRWLVAATNAETKIPPSSIFAESAVNRLTFLPLRLRARTTQANRLPAAV